MDIKKNFVTRRHALMIGGAAVASSLISPSLSLAEPAAKGGKAKITQVRNATLLVEYGGARFLVDPMLSDKGAFPGFPGTAIVSFGTRSSICLCRSTGSWMSMRSS